MNSESVIKIRKELIKQINPKDFKYKSSKAYDVFKNKDIKDIGNLVLKYKLILNLNQEMLKLLFLRVYILICYL